MLHNIIKGNRLCITLILTAAWLAGCDKNASNQSTVSDLNVQNPVDKVSVTQWIKGWNSTSSLSAPRAGAASVVVNNHIYVIGGIDGMDFTPLTEYARINDDGSLGAWQIGSPLNEERGFIDAVVSDGYIYVVGGGNGPNGKNLLQSVERAKVNSDGSLAAWETLANGLITPRRCSKVAIKGNYIYALGGFAGALLDSVERAEILANGDLGPWQVENISMTMPRYVNSVKTADEHVYVIGGHDQLKGVGINDVEWATPNISGGIDQWKAASPMQVGRYGLSSASHGSAVYALGGLTGLEYLNSVEVAQFNENGELGAWQFTTPMSEPRATFNVVTHNGYMYVIGGTNQDAYLASVEFTLVNEQNELGFWGTPQQAQAYQARIEQLQQNKPQLPNAGVVKDIRHASMYTYMQVVNDQGAIWIAGPKTEAVINDKIAFSKGVTMSNFYSKELQQSFPVILFVSKIEKL